MRIFLPAFIIFFVLSSSSIYAAEGSLKVAPAVTEVIIGSNEKEKTIEFSYTNNSSEHLSLEFEPVNFRQKGDFGEIGFLTSGEGTYQYSLSPFLTLQTNTLEIAPKESKKIIVIVKNRDDLTPGGHYAALIAKVANTHEGSDTLVYPSLSSLILLRKTGGELFNLSLKDSNFPRGNVVFSYPKSLTLLFQNEGNVHMVPYGRVEIRDLFNRLLYKGIINSSSLSILPSSRRYLSVPVLRTAFSFPFSINSVFITGTDSLKKTRFVYKDTFIYVNPALLLLLIAAPFILKFVRKK